MGRMMIGAVIVAFLAAITGGMQFLLLSIVCTSGLSLIGWLPLCYIVGWIATAGWRASQPGGEAATGITRLDGASVPAGPPATIDAEAARALDRYLRAARTQGRSDADIRDVLLRARWPAAGVDALLDPKRPGGAEGELWLR